MRRKIIKLTESDLARIVRRVIKEEEEDVYMSTPATQRGFYGGKTDRPVKGDELDLSDFDTKTFGPEDYDDFMDFINDCDTIFCTKTKRMYDLYAAKGPVVVSKRRK